MPALCYRKATQIICTGSLLVLSLLLTCANTFTAEGYLPVTGYTEPVSGEHPRLLFRKADLPAIRERAASPAGKAIVARLKQLLDGGDGRSLPKHKRPMDVESGDRTPAIMLPANGSFTMAHAAGYGFLFQLTGDQHYADLAKTCMDWTLAGQRDRDASGRYSFREPSGALRAGPPLGLAALAYDLCYEAWSPDYRLMVAKELANYDEGEDEDDKTKTLLNLAKGARLGPTSNHAGPQIGGGALVALALWKDPGVDQDMLQTVREASIDAIQRQLRIGWSQGGWFIEGDGAGTISSDNGFLMGVQAWRIAGGKDFVTPWLQTQMMTMKWLYGTVMDEGKPLFPARAMYPHNVWVRSGSDTPGGGMSGCGQFSQGFGVVTAQQASALHWFYDAFFKAGDNKAQTPCDTASPYPHRAILALLNWPLNTAPAEPSTVLPLCSRQLTKDNYFFCRNRWRDDDDIVVSVITSDELFVRCLGRGVNQLVGILPKGRISYEHVYADGSAIISLAGVDSYFMADFNKGDSNQADLVMALGGRGYLMGRHRLPAAGTIKAKRGYTIHITHMTLDEKPFIIQTWQKGQPPQVSSTGNSFTVGDQSYVFDGDKIIAEARNAADRSSSAAAVAQAISDASDSIALCQKQCQERKGDRTWQLAALTHLHDKLGIKALEDLHRGFRHADPIVSKKAAALLSARQESEVTTQILQWIEADPALTANYLALLKQRGDKTARQRIAPLIDHRNDKVHLQALLASMALADKAEDVIADLHKARFPFKRQSLAQALAALPTSPITAKLPALLLEAGAEAEKRRATISKTRKKTMSEEQQAQIRRQANLAKDQGKLFIELIGHVNDDAVLPILKEALKGRAAGQVIVGMTNSPHARLDSVFKDLLDNPQGGNLMRLWGSWIKRVAMNTNWSTKDRLQVLQQGLQQSEKEGFERLREGVAANLGRLEDPVVFPIIRTLLQDESERVRRAACMSLFHYFYSHRDASDAMVDQIKAELLHAKTQGAPERTVRHIDRILREWF